MRAHDFLDYRKARAGAVAFADASGKRLPDARLVGLGMKALIALTKAFMAAQEEANAYIQKNRKGAAETFLRMSKIKMTQDEMEKILADPDTQFSTMPDGIVQYVTFMDKAGSIKARPAKWTDLFVTDFQNRKGS
jgi:ABC-type nitrate/sulfonate/bicarbonate transport system substrate-binding protein